MKIVMLDRNSLGYDVDISIFEELGDFTCYDVASKELTKEYIKDANVIIFNKAVMNEDMLKNALDVKLLCVTGTGTDNIDIAYAKSRNIAVTNVRDYSTPAVVQHTFTLVLYLLEKIAYYDDYVKSGKYSQQLGFSSFDMKYHELSGMTWGIVGMGNIGKGVAKIAQCFGCNIIFYSASGNNNTSEFQRVEFNELLEKSDILSIHCPLSDRTRNLFNIDAFRKMKKSAILVNVARGAVVKDNDLYTALTENLIAGAGLDVLGKEPMEKSNPLSKISDSCKLLITPHMGWASVESRTRCMKEIYENIKSFQNGIERNLL